MRRTPVLLALSALVAAALSTPTASDAAPVRTAVSHAAADSAVAVVRAAPHREQPPRKRATAVGSGGAVTSVDADASRIGLGVLRRGGNAVDAAVATAAALGVTEPFSAGVGGGGYFVYYDARTHRVQTIDGRETAPAAIPRDPFLDGATGKPYEFTPDLVTSGVAVGTPGTPATWTTALRRWGTRSLATVLAPSEQLARRGFVVDPTFRGQTQDNRGRFEAFTSTRRLYFPHGRAPRVGTRFRNPDLARTYRAFGRNPRLFYRGALPRQISRVVHRPPVVAGTTLPVPAGYLTPRDFARYGARVQAPTSIGYRGYRVYGVAPSSSGGLTVGESLGILRHFDLAAMRPVDAVHHYLEASALAFADRAAYVGDSRFVRVPSGALLGRRFTAERACRIAPRHAFDTPVAAGDVRRADGRCAPGEAGRSGRSGRSGPIEDHENVETSHLTVADRWGNVVAYTLTIEQTGGSGIVVPGRGFLLNNELTDFSLVYDRHDPNRVEPGKRPRSSISPTVVLRGGRPVLALGSPGGSTIITTVLQILMNRLDLHMTLPQAIAAPRASQRDTAAVSAEPAFVRRYGATLRSYGHRIETLGDSYTSADEIGAATGIEFGPGGRLTAAAEPVRRGGGSARVLHLERR